MTRRSHIVDLDPRVKPGDDGRKKKSPGMTEEKKETGDDNKKGVGNDEERKGEEKKVKKRELMGRNFMNKVEKPVSVYSFIFLFYGNLVVD